MHTDVKISGRRSRPMGEGGGGGGLPVSKRVGCDREKGCWRSNGSCCEGLKIGQEELQ